MVFADFLFLLFLPAPVPQSCSCHFLQPPPSPLTHHVENAVCRRASARRGAARVPASGEASGEAQRSTSGPSRAWCTRASEPARYPKEWAQPGLLRATGKERRGWRTRTEELGVEAGVAGGWEERGWCVVARGGGWRVGGEGEASGDGRLRGALRVI